MSNAAKSILVFGIYLALTGLVFLVVPNTLLALFGFPTTNEPWIRVVGLLTVILAYYYIQAACDEAEPFFRATVYGRPILIAGFIVFVVLGLAPPTLIIFGLPDLLGAIWTGLILRTRSA
jgi:hypothetical protein